MITPLQIPGYRIERMLAKGGMAEVYLAEQLSLGRKVAIKVMDGSTGGHEFAERFLHEARLVAALNHSNLITIYDFGPLDGGRLFLSMEYLQGGDLEERLARGVTEKTAVRIVRELASVLGFVHANGIVHRDIKPANILFRQDETLVLTDFGIAKKISNDVGLTQAGMIVGSAAYGSPEQMQALELNQRADIYSVGVVFLEMLTGKNPFKADTFINTAMNHIQMPVPALSGSAARFQTLLEKMLAKKPQARFANMEEVLAQLDSISPQTGQHPAEHDADRTVITSSAGKISITAPHTIHIPAAPVADLDDDFGDLDDFDAEAMKLLEETDLSLTARTARVEAARPASKASADKPAPASRGSLPNRYINVRTRPLPSNLLDDD